MLKDNNYWVSEDVKGGLYIGCYDDMLTVKVGQTLGSIRHRALQIDQNADGHFIVQFYYQFKKKFVDPNLNKVFALAMEDLLHNWMTKFCSPSSESLHKYRGEDHYECSQKACKIFFDYLEMNYGEIIRIFRDYEEHLAKICTIYMYDLSEMTQKEALLFLLRKFNGVELKEHIQYKTGEDIQNERLAKIGFTRETVMKMTWEDIGKLLNEAEGLLQYKIASAIIETRGEKGRFLKMKKRIIDAFLEEDE